MPPPKCSSPNSQPPTTAGAAGTGPARSAAPGCRAATIAVAAGDAGVAAAERAQRTAERNVHVERRAVIARPRRAPRAMRSTHCASLGVRLPVRHGRIAGVARAGDVVLRDQRVGQRGTHREHLPLDLQRQPHIVLGRVLQHAVPEAADPAARSAAGSASTRANSARRRASSSCGGSSNHCGSMLPCTLQRVALRAQRLDQIVPPVDPEALQIDARAAPPSAQVRCRASSRSAACRGQRARNCCTTAASGRRRQLREPLGCERTGRCVKDRHAVGAGLAPAAPCWRPAARAAAR